MRGVIRKGLGVSAGFILLAPASAFASTASIDAGGIARLQASANEANSVTLGELPGLFPGTKTVVFTDAVPIQVQGNCVHPNLNSSRIVHCVVPESSTLVRVALEDENDRLEPSSINPPTTIRLSSEGDGGNDVLIGTPNRDVLDGVGGKDTIRGRDGNDGLEGGTGDDDVKGENGDDFVNGDDNSGGDLLDCGAGVDSLLFNAGDIVASTTCESQQQD
jgi:Ca2+-binding RTX toxin-like protein